MTWRKVTLTPVQGALDDRETLHQNEILGNRISYKCAPSDRAMKGSKDQSFSTAGSVPSSAMQCSISGPLQAHVSVSYFGVSVLPPLRLHVYGGLGLGMSGSPCMVEIYDQNNWVLLMLSSHRAGSCSKVEFKGSGGFLQ